ncbi:MAG: YaaR family protein [Defluviitaleaceae bacterium]|nr:YaaR family protein [Defluviitaleaceae bacterium]
MDMKISEVLMSRLIEQQTAIEKKTGPDFSFTLNSLGEEGLATRLKTLMDDIAVCGSNLAEHMDLSDMKRYRALISDFINEVVSNSHKFSRENFLDKRGHHRVYGIVKLVNKNLDDLAQELLKTEKDHLAILDKIGEISGLLLDLVV